jgi:radical SAM superfamily enzyme YgiQ (UPF0313 family)
MKVVLINMPITYAVNPGKQTPVGLLYLAQALKNVKVKCKIVDFSDRDEETILDRDIPAADIYGITATSVQIYQANRFAKLIKMINPFATIVIGGPGTMAKELIDRSLFTSICIGDGEESIVEMTKDFPWLKGTYDNQVQNLDSIPIPDRGEFGFGSDLVGKSDTKSAMIITIRGCPFNCAFCTAKRTQLRYRSVNNIEQEIAYLKSKGVEQIGFTDDMFTAKLDRAMEICDILKFYDMKWKVFCRVKPFNEVIAKKMKDCGCVEIGFGVESFDQKVLNVLRKSSTVIDNISAIGTAYEAGLNVKVLFMIRTPGQTADTMEINMKELSKLKYGMVSCHNFIPIPGSAIWNDPEAFGIEILDRDIDNYNFYLYGKSGRNKWRDLIKPLDRSLEDFNRESEEFVQFIERTSTINRG